MSYIAIFCSTECSPSIRLYIFLGFRLIEAAPRVAVLMFCATFTFFDESSLFQFKRKARLAEYETPVKLKKQTEKKTKAERHQAMREQVSLRAVFLGATADMHQPWQ